MRNIIIVLTIAITVILSGCARQAVVNTTPDQVVVDVEHDGDQVIYGDDEDQDGIYMVLTIRGDGPRDTRSASWRGDTYGYDR
jgi:hypothetical protein